MNDRDEPIYISIEPYPECYELEPGEELTMIYVPRANDVLSEVKVIDVHNLVIWPPDNVYDWTILIDGKDAEYRNWNFKHLHLAAKPRKAVIPKRWKFLMLINLMLRRR